MRSPSCHPVRSLALLRRYTLIKLTGQVRQWEKRPLAQRKRQVLTLFGSMALLLVINLGLRLEKPVLRIQPAGTYSIDTAQDSLEHHHLYMNELKNHKPTPIR